MAPKNSLVSATASASPTRRTATDRGVFVLLDRQTPGRLLSAFPPGVAVRRVGLAEAVAETRTFLSVTPHPDHPPRGGRETSPGEG